MAQNFPALFSHSNRSNASVAHVLASFDLHLDLAPRLSHAAECKLPHPRNVLASVNVNLQDAHRRTTRESGKQLTAKLAYSVLWKSRPIDILAPAIWRNYAPNKCRLFLWLASKDRLYTNERRFRRGITTAANCPFCDQSETITHLLFSCGELAPLWEELDSVCNNTPQGILHAWNDEFNNKTRSTVLLALLWNIWKRRNAKVFRNVHLDLHATTSATAEDLRLWSHRCNKAINKTLLTDWSTMLFHLAERM
ncbi:hypothetical protein D1007_37424 [Hordeum vulgare]|nr:hypothetical protein D1007_37424 [Hordeum vulgare]